MVRRQQYTTSNAQFVKFRFQVAVFGGRGTSDKGPVQREVLNPPIASITQIHVTDHTFWHKWILLTDPADKDAGVKGYVLVSISILGPGDKIKSPPKLSNVDEIDMESNVLQPAGVQLQPCTYTIRVYKAEDLPESKYFSLWFSKFYSRLIDDPIHPTCCTLFCSFAFRIAPMGNFRKCCSILCKNYK